MSNATIQTLPSPIQADIRTPAIFKTVTEFIAAAAKTIGTRPSHAGDPTRLHRLNDHVLKDIGVSRHHIGAGAMESFWRE
ncbi:MAG: hypothetical protein IIC06_06080 [Proteobacteria bacterium]|nr:hypothetical protein [Pseudomonadota bacterium]